MTAGAKTFKIVHDKIRTETGASSEDEVGLEGPGDRVGAGDIPSAPAMGHGVGVILAGRVQTAIVANGAV